MFPVSPPFSTERLVSYVLPTRHTTKDLRMELAGESSKVGECAASMLLADKSEGILGLASQSGASPPRQGQQLLEEPGPPQCSMGPHRAELATIPRHSAYSLFLQPS